MLGLRPRLKPRPSLLDLVTKKDIDRLSSHPAPLSPPKTNVGQEDTPDPLSTKLPETPFEERSEPIAQKEKKKTDTVKMAPVRTWAGYKQGQAKSRLTIHTEEARSGR